MSASPSSAYDYQIGGCLPPDALTYVTRQADDDLYQGVKTGQFCYVLNSRQMGKSSLRVRTMERLCAEGVACAAVDLTAIGSQDITSSQWYAGITYALASNFNLLDTFDMGSWWCDREFLTPVQRLSEFIREVLLREIHQNLAIFVDEIDSILSLNFHVDDFFALIRWCYNQRADQPNYKRLTWVLLGVATPSDLIHSTNYSTPFNIGFPIELSGFQWHEARPLAGGFEGKVNRPIAVLTEVLDWTGGQPFLTQKLCKLIVQEIGRDVPVERLYESGEFLENSQSSIPEGSEAEWVENLVRHRLIENWEANDQPEHLRTIRDRLLSNEQRTLRLLGLYQQILQRGEIVANDTPEQMQLRLSGLVVKQNGKLKVYNRIYQSIFNLNWVNEVLANLRPYSEALVAWEVSNRQDESHLLRGQVLRDALVWAADKSLSDRDFQFLAASQALEIRAVTQAHQQLTQAQPKSEYKEREEGARLERAGMEALQQFESAQIEALLSAMQAGQALKALVKEGRPLQDYPTTSPLLALQTILDNIHERNRFEGHQGQVWSVSFSPDGNYLVTVGTDGIVYLWNCFGQLVTQWKGHQDWIRSVSFSPDGQCLVTAGEDGLAKLWGLSGQLLAQFQGHQGGVSSVSFSPDEQQIATVGEDGVVRLWELSGHLLIEFQGHQDYIHSVSFSPDGQCLVTAANDGIICIWNLSGTLLVELQGHEYWVRSASFSPDGQCLVTAGEDGKVILWDLSGNQLAQLNGHWGSVRKVSFSPDGQYLATAGADGTARLWNLFGKQLAQFNGHLSGVKEDSRVKPERVIVQDLSFSPDGQYLATAGNDSTARLWDLSEKHLAQWHGGQGIVWSLSFSPDGQCIATAGHSGVVKVWNLSGQLIAQWQAYHGWFTVVSFSPDGLCIATCGQDGLARLWNLSGQQLAECNTYQGRLLEVNFSPDGQCLGLVGENGTARLWSLSGQQLAHFYGHQWQIRMSFSPDGQKVATAGGEGTVQLWNLSGQQLAQFDTHQDPVRSVKFSPDGQLLATAGGVSTVQLWDLFGRQLARWNTGQEKILAVSFSPNGERLATAGWDGTVRVWDLSGRLIAHWNGHQGEVTSISFSPDGQCLATAGEDGTIGLWRIEGLDELLARGCDWLKDYLATHPEELEKLEVCQNRFKSIEVDGNLARVGDVEGTLTNPPIEPIVPDDLNSERGVNYTRLRELLKAGQWQEADSETTMLMLGIAEREAEGWLREEDIEKFPCADLLTIDQLWVKYSNRRFGFSVQKDIWQSVGGMKNADYEVYYSFGKRIEWRDRGLWLYHSELTFDTWAPVGHLPGGVLSWLWSSYQEASQLGLWVESADGLKHRVWWNIISSLASKLEECNRQ